MTGKSPIYFCTQFLGLEEKRAVSKVLDSDWVTTLGPAQEEFEESFSMALGGAQHALALCSGTAALELFYESLKLKPGDVVVCSTLTFIASVGPAARRGASICFVDSEPSTWSMCPEALEEALLRLKRKRKRIRAVCLPYIYGQTASTHKINKICRRAGVPLFEDAAEALGTLVRGVPAGTVGFASAFSFNGNKMITTGGGGMLCSAKRSFIESSRRLAFQAKEVGSFDYKHFDYGFNFRLSNVLAAIGNEQLKKLNRILERKREIHEIYAAWARQSGACEILESNGSKGDRASYWLNVIRLGGGAKWRLPLVKALKDQNIQTRPVWFPLHRQKIFSGSDLVGGDFAWSAYRESICLPSGLSLTNSDLYRVTEALDRFFRSRPKPKAHRRRLLSSPVLESPVAL